MAEMTKEKWISIGLKIAEHLEEILKVAKRNNILICLSAFGEDGTATAVYIEGEDLEGDQYSVRIRADSTVDLEVNQHAYYAKA